MKELKSSGSKALAAEAAAHDADMGALFGRCTASCSPMCWTAPKHIHQMISFVLIARYLERTGGHITNVCEWIVYNATDKRVVLGYPKQEQLK